MFVFNSNLERVCYNGFELPKVAKFVCYITFGIKLLNFDSEFYFYNLKTSNNEIYKITTNLYKML